MSIAKLFVKVFNENIFEDRAESVSSKEHETATISSVQTGKSSSKQSLTLSEQMVLVKSWLKDKLDAIESNCREAILEQHCDMRSRLGPELVIFDIDYSSTVRIASDRLSVRSQGSFNTIKANVCVYGGRWIYGEKWQTGDIIGIAIDVDKEEISFYRNGKSLGVAFKKLEKGPGITFFPGISLGYNQGVQANFGNAPFKYPVEGFRPLMAKPIDDLQKADLLMNYMVNLATVVSRYNNAHEKKAGDDKLSTKKTVYIVFCTLLIEKLLPILFSQYIIEEKVLLYIKTLSNIKNESDSVQPGHSDSVLGCMLDMFWNYLEAEEMKFILKKLANALLSTYSHTHKHLDYERQRQSLQVLIALCNHTKTRKTYLEFKFFKKHFLALLMCTRPPEFTYMQELIPNHLAWTDGIGGSKGRYMSAVEKITKSTEYLYILQKTLLLTLLNNTDADSRSPSSRKLFLAKARRYIMDLSMEQRPFHSFFFMQSSILHPIENSVALAFICILVDVTKTLFEKELATAEVQIPSKYFYDGSLEYQHYDRVGGVLSHLRKVHHNDIVQQLGTERTQALLDDDRVVVRVAELGPFVSVAADTLNNISIVGRPGGTTTTTFTTFLNPRVTQVFEIASVRDEIAALNDALNETKYYRETVAKKLQVVEDHTGCCLTDYSQVMSELKTKFATRENVFAQRSIDLSRKQAWFRSVALGAKRRATLIWFLEKTLRTLNISSQGGVLFAFVPEVYVNILPILLDTVMDFSNHDLLFQFEVNDSECVLNIMADFLSVHSADPRIILASCKDSLLQALGTLTCHKPGIKALEKSPRKSQVSLVKALLRPYENRAWGQSNWLLLRFWLGEGFAYKDARQPCVWQGGNVPFQLGLCRSRSKNESHTGLLHNIAPPNPSKYFQKLIGEKLTEDEPFATTFLNSVLSQLNWAFSEFILLLQEIQNTALRQENTVFEPKQLKICSMCFELTVSLMRCLEMIITIAPEIFHDAARPNSDLILTRVCQLISQVLSRVTVPPGCFQFVVDMCSADLNAVTHFPIIAAALGILLALLRPEMENDKNPSKVTRITRALLTDPSFQFANLEFALGEIKTPILQQSEIPRGNFDPSTRAHIDPLTNDVRVPQPTSSKRIRADPPIIKFTLSDFPTHVSNEEIEDVRRLIEMLKVKQSLLSDITLPSEDSLCPICCAKPIAVMFTPCKHQSCSNCILQHLMNSKVCFYCKTLIKTIETPDGTVIYQNNDYLQAPSIFEV
uniref:RING-type E3 ubiquitin transferase n=1 Tax=Glossina brevipalpis TaxID=37001 RepID=A0A1A9W1K7_9MUSC